MLCSRQTTLEKSETRAFELVPVGSIHPARPWRVDARRNALGTDIPATLAAASLVCLETGANAPVHQQLAQWSWAEPLPPEKETTSKPNELQSDPRAAETARACRRPAQARCRLQLCLSRLCLGLTFCFCFFVFFFCCANLALPPCRCRWFLSLPSWAAMPRLRERMSAANKCWSLFARHADRPGGDLEPRILAESVEMSKQATQATQAREARKLERGPGRPSPIT